MLFEPGANDFEPGTKISTYRFWSWRRTYSFPKKRYRGPFNVKLFREQVNAIQIEDGAVQCNAGRYDSVQYNTLQHNTVPYHAIWYNAQRYDTQHKTIQYSTVHSVSLLYHKVQDKCKRKNVENSV